MAISFDSNSIVVQRATGQTRKKQIYLTELDTVRLSCFYEKAFATGASLTVTWATVPDGNTNVTLASQTDTLLATEIYATAADGTDGARTVVKCTATDGTEAFTTSYTLYCTQT